MTVTARMTAARREVERTHRAAMAALAELAAALDEAWPELPEWAPDPLPRNAGGDVTYATGGVDEVMVGDWVQQVHGWPKDEWREVVEVRTLSPVDRIALCFGDGSLVSYAETCPILIATAAVPSQRLAEARYELEQQDHYIDPATGAPAYAGDEAF